MEGLEEKARNHYILALFGEKKGMTSEAISNYFKSLFAVCDFTLAGKTGSEPKDHTERFRMLEKTDRFLYELLDTLFSVYRKTYTSRLTKARVEHIRKKVDEAFKYAKIEIPTEKDL